jgi:hypothetical protein
MAHSSAQIRSARRNAGFVKTMVNLLASCNSALKRQLGKVETQRALSGLTDDELRDFGREDLTPKPVIPIEAGLITRLMSMR